MKPKTSDSYSSENVSFIAVSEYDNFINLYITGTFSYEIILPSIELTSETRNTYYLTKYSFEQPQIPDTLYYNNNFLIYPNPANELFNIKYKDISPEQIALNIYDIRGKHLFSKSYTNHENNLIENINISHLNSGMYFLKIQYGDIVVYKKLIVSQ